MVVVAKDILVVNHPLNATFRAWLATKGNLPPTKRQAREFLAKFPLFKRAQTT